MGQGYEIIYPPRLMKNEDYGDRYNGPYNDPSYFYAAQGFDRKAASISSNHVDPTAYSRSWARVVSDVPVHNVKYAWDGTKHQVFHLSGYDSNVQDYPGDAWFPLLDNAESKALTAARNKLRDKNSFNLGVAIGEARSTAEMLATRGIGLAQALLNFKRYAYSMPKNVREYLLRFAGAWLEGYYGWGSLARDAYALDGALRSQVKEPLTFSVHSTVKISDNWGPFNVDAVRRRTWENEGLARVGYRAAIISELARNADKWGLLNPFEIAWELVPYSFCVDWLCPIGNTLSSLSATAGLEFKSGYVTRFYRSRIKTDWFNLNPYPYESETLDRGSYVVESGSMTRRYANGFLMPQLYANDNPFSTPRVTSAVALITQTVLNR